METLKKLVARCNEMDITEQINWLFDASMPYQAQKELAALEAVAEAARAVVFEYWESPESTPSKANIAMKELVDKVAALKGAE